MNFKAFKSKSAKSDYTEAMLPHNRKQVFFDVFKLNWKQFLLFGLLIFLFSFPMHTLSFAEDMYNSVITKDLHLLSEEEQLSVYFQLLGLENLRGFLNIFSFLILSAGLSGLIRVIRQYAWEENVVFSVDFFRGIKQNIGQMLLLGLTVGVINALSVFLYNLAIVNSEANGTASVVMLLLVGFSVFIGIPTAAYATVAAAIYSNKFHHNIIIGFTMLAKAPLKTYGMLICCFIPFIPQMLNNFYCHLIGRIIGCFFAPFVMLMWFLFAMNIFDKYVNEERFPALVGRGTFPE